MTKEAMKQALEALEDYRSGCQTKYDADKAITSLRQAIAEAEKQEPVAWRTFDGEGGYDYRDYQMNENYRDAYIKRNGTKYLSWVEPLYTSPPKHEPCPFVVSTREGTHHCSLSHREPLTDEQISAIDWKQNETLHDFARAIEAAHNIFGDKNDAR